MSNLINKKDAWFYVIVVAPALLLAALLAFLNIWLVPIGAFFGLVIGFGLIPFLFTRVAPDVLCARNFLGVTVFFTDCWVFSPPGYSTLVFMPGSQEAFFTSRKTNEQSSLIVQLRHGNAHGETDEQLVVLKVVYRLNIWDDPSTVLKAYYREFICRDDERIDVAMDRALRNKVEPDVAAVAIATADAILQTYYMEDLLTDVGPANIALTTGLKKEMQDIGIVLILTAIEAVEDVRPGGYVSSRSAAASAKRQSLARQDQAKAEQEAGTAEQLSRRSVLNEQEVTEGKARDVAAVQADASIRELVARLNVLGNSDTQIAALIAKVDQLDGQELAKVVKGLQGVAWPQGGHVVGVESPLLRALSTLIENSTKKTVP